MVETDWREILNFTQKELATADKEKLCESLSWMEADDIELNFSDLKTLFRLSQDILKFKSEQVNNLLGKLENSRRKSGKVKTKSSLADSPTKSSDNVFETMSHQEEIIKANKEILEQLYTDIAELEAKKKKLTEDKPNADIDSESSRDPLSEMNAIAQLENEVVMKNRHIRKLLGDVKMLEEDNTKLKAKVTILKDKLTEATAIIENFTEKMFSINNENKQLKENLGKLEEDKAQLSVDLEYLRKDYFEKENHKDNFYEEIKSKAQHWKNLAKSKKVEVEALFNENTKLKESLIQVSRATTSPLSGANQREINKQTAILKELQENLTEATNEIIRSTALIESLRAENRQLKSCIDEPIDYSVSETNRNESDDGKQKSLINKLKRKVKYLTAALQGSEEMLSNREKELSEITSQLQSLQSEEGIRNLVEGLKSKKRHIKMQDEGIKTLVQDVNNLNQIINDLQLENETLRQKCNIPCDQPVDTSGIVKKFAEIKQRNISLLKQFNKTENKLLNLEFDNREMKNKLQNIASYLENQGYERTIIEEIYQKDNKRMPMDGGGDASIVLARHEQDIKEQLDLDVKAIIEENEGLRKSLQEMLDFLKDNSTSSSGVLALECPSLDTLLQAMEARHAAGWFAPHMAAIMELRAVRGGRDVLLSALHEARKETYSVMNQLSQESQKALELEKKVRELETTKGTDTNNTKVTDATNNDSVINFEFGSWINNKLMDDFDLCAKEQIGSLVNKNNLAYEEQLKNSLSYFHNKFKELSDKMRVLVIQTTDDQNKWSLQEEELKAEIENLKSQLHQKDDEDADDISPGLMVTPSTETLQRKCTYLEESYKYIRTLNENVKNELLDRNKKILSIEGEYETRIQKLIISVANLTDKLRDSVPLDLFWKQNVRFNETVTKYRYLLENSMGHHGEPLKLIERLQQDRGEIAEMFKMRQNDSPKKEKSLLSNVEQTILTKQIETLCSELEDKKNYVDKLKNTIQQLEQNQAKLIDESMASVTAEDVKLLREQLENTTKENSLLKEQCQHVGKQLDIALLQLQDSQQRHMSNDLEVNMLRHQILDLQSPGDSKAIIARLSSEILIAHLQASESHKTIDRINSALNKEKQLRLQVEEMLASRQRIFDVYAFRYESKFRYFYEVMQNLRLLYQGSLPIISLENYLNSREDIARKSISLNEQLDEIEDLRSSFMIKHSVYDQILDVTKNCLDSEDSCQHKLSNIVQQGIYSREIDHLKKKVQILENSREEALKRCNNLEKTLILVNQGFQTTIPNDIPERRNSVEVGEILNLHLEDIPSDNESASTRTSQTITLPKPQVLKPITDSNSSFDMTKMRKEESIVGNKVIDTKNIIKDNVRQTDTISVSVQTIHQEIMKKPKSLQTDEDPVISEQQNKLRNLNKENEIKTKKISDLNSLLQNKEEEILYFKKEITKLEASNKNLEESYYEVDTINHRLRSNIDDLTKQLNDLKNMHIERHNQSINIAQGENKALLLALKQIENEKDKLVLEYKELFDKNREEYAKSMKELNLQVQELQGELNRKGSISNDTRKEVSSVSDNKYMLKIVEIENKNFKLQSELDECTSQLAIYRSEMERWKELASERLAKMEQLSSQLQERHFHEVESYKAENQHWLSQLSDTQKEHLELRSRLSEQKTIHVKQMAEKDAQIEQLRNVIHGLKTQIMNMQNLLSVSDPSFDLSAIVEVEEVSDGSQQGSDRLQLKFESTADLGDNQDDVRMSGSTTAIWHEPLIERLRREKQMTSKQNALLRRQIKALAARERRARLDAQNLKNQVFRISTSGNKTTTAETAALHGKISSLQAQLLSARRDSQSTVALWDKWKRAQQSSERWQARFEEKCQEVNKVEAGLNMAKSALARLEREKRVLLNRLAGFKNEKPISYEKQDTEQLEKSFGSSRACSCKEDSPVSSRALLERVQAQQRRIVALEVAEKGNEHLVSEYEKALAENTSLKGQVLKLESALLESQICSPIKSNEPHPELEYWKSYCEMLKEENVQLTLKVNSVEITPTTAHQHRINDLEQTVLMLRGLVSKLQAEQKSSGILTRKGVDSRPSSGRSISDKNLNQLESYRIEIANLKRSIQDKDLLLERSKEMLKIAAEREDELLRENAFLRRQNDELRRPKGGFLSA